MKAVILIGGLGTRLRPLTLHTPKPLLPILNRPFLAYQFDLLRRHGIHEVILCTAYRSDAFRRTFADGRRWGIHITYVEEKKPLGTGGAIKNAEPFLNGRTLILNGDVLLTLDVTRMTRFHQSHGAAVTIALTPVPDPTPFGLLVTGREGRVKQYIEKPTPREIVGNTINAGAYLFEPEVLAYLPEGIPYSVETGLFPRLLRMGTRVFGYVTKGYWMDIGTTQKYLQAHRDLLDGRLQKKPLGRRIRRSVWAEGGTRLPSSVKIRGKAVLGPGTRIGSGVELRGAVTLGRGCRIGSGAILSDCILLDGCQVGERSHLEGCIAGARTRIDADVTIAPGTALGDGSHVTRYSKL